jgi:hypothetical protein
MKKAKYALRQQIDCICLQLAGQNYHSGSSNKENYHMKARTIMFVAALALTPVAGFSRADTTSVAADATIADEGAAAVAVPPSQAASIAAAVSATLPPGTESSVFVNIATQVDNAQPSQRESVAGVVALVASGKGLSLGALAQAISNASGGALTATQVTAAANSPEIADIAGNLPGGPGTIFGGTPEVNPPVPGIGGTISPAS